MEQLAIWRQADHEVVLRRATQADVPEIVRLLADDALGATREADPDDPAYRAAFAVIDADPAHLLVSAVRQQRLVGTMQLSFLPGLARRGAWRAQVEAVRVAQALRGQGFGEFMLRWAIAEARRRDCALVQLTTDKSRAGAHRLYERLGFVASHEGMKLRLSD